MIDTYAQRQRQECDLLVCRPVEATLALHLDNTQQTHVNNFTRQHVHSTLAQSVHKSSSLPVYHRSFTFWSACLTWLLGFFRHCCWFLVISSRSRGPWRCLQCCITSHTHTHARTHTDRHIYIHHRHNFVCDGRDISPVSYTHLTLPTIYSV